MDLSINKLKNTSKENLNFKGLKGKINSKNQPVYRFTLPPHKSNEKAYIEIYKVNKNENGIYSIPDKKGKYMRKSFDGKEFTEIRHDTIKGFASQGEPFAYRYRFETPDGHVRYATDDYAKIKLEENGETSLFNINEGYTITPKTGSMRHSFLDSDAIMTPDKTTIKKQDENFVRNHFNKQGGTIEGLNYLLLETDELAPYRYIMTTPDIGVDRISSHKYWPNNLYQCNDMQQFLDFNFNLFKKGKGYVADGAFTSQGLQSPLVQHVLKWGSKSPFYHMLKLDGIPTLGILPEPDLTDGENPRDHVGIKLVNGEKSAKYNPNKPTYIQFFDDRLSPINQQKADALIEKYDRSNSEDRYDITTNEDSVQPYYFEVNPKDKKIEETFKNTNVVMLSDVDADFLRFPYFTIGNKNSADSATYWAGNVDIVKMNTSNPKTDNKDENYEGFLRAREYIINAARFWTEGVQQDYIRQTAKASREERNDIARANGVNLEDIDPESSKIEFPILKQNKTARDYILEFPLQSIEASPETSAIFAQKAFNDELLDEKTTNKLEGIVKQAISSVIPEEYKENDDYKTYVTKIYSNKILKSLYIGAMDEKAIIQTPIDLSKTKDVKEADLYDFERLKDVTLLSLLDGNIPNNPDNERKIVVERIKNHISAKNISKNLLRSIKEDLKGISLNDFKEAESIVLQGEGGLNWRFDAAKDIGDLDSFSNTTNGFATIWQGDKQFGGTENLWRDFIKNVTPYNPGSYVVVEMTDIGTYGPWDDYEKLLSFDEGLTKEFVSNLIAEENKNLAKISKEIKEKDPNYSDQKIKNWRDDLNEASDKLKKGENKLGAVQNLAKEYGKEYLRILDIYNHKNFENEEYVKKAIKSGEVDEDGSNLKEVMKKIYKKDFKNSLINRDGTTQYVAAKMIADTMSQYAKVLEEADESTSKRDIQVAIDYFRNLPIEYIKECLKEIDKEYIDSDDDLTLEQFVNILANGDRDALGKVVSQIQKRLKIHCGVLKPKENPDEEEKEIKDLSAEQKAEILKVVPKEIDDIVEKYGLEGQIRVKYQNIGDDDLTRELKKFGINLYYVYTNHPMYQKTNHFITNIGATTYSNYDKYFNKLSEFVGVNPENGGIGKGGDLQDLKTAMEDVIQNAQSNTLLSHMFTSNHDKPRVLHTIPIDINLFLKDGKKAIYEYLTEENKEDVKQADGTLKSVSKYIEVKQADGTVKKVKDYKRPKLKKQVEELIGKQIESKDDLKDISAKALAVGIEMRRVIIEQEKNADIQKALLKSLKNLVLGMHNGKRSFKRSLNFGTTPYEISIRDIYNNAQIENSESKIREFNEKFPGKKALDLSASLWEMMSALYGTPTMFAGDEFGQTGYETPSKNQYVGNRNQVLHNRKNEQGSFSKFYAKTKAITGLTNLSGMSAIREGMPISLEITEENGVKMWPIYKYDDKDSKVVQVVTDYNVPHKSTSYDFIKNDTDIKPIKVGSIEIKDNNGNCPFEEGTRLKRKVYVPKISTYVDEKTEGNKVARTYTVKDGKIVANDGKEIEVNDTVLNFYKAA